jgi:ribonuclease HI
MTIDEDALSIYTDGSSLGKPRTGGIGVRFVTIGSDGFEVVEDLNLFGYPGATNNQMELRACIEALKHSIKFNFIEGYTKILVWTDSLYVVDNYPKALFEWPKRQWKLRSGRPAENVELWKDLRKLSIKLNQMGIGVYIKWVKGHSNDPHNRAVDKLAKLSAKAPYNKPLSVVRLRRKLSAQSTEVGSVEIAGQRMTIRIISSEYHPTHKLWEYRYEVMSSTRLDYGCVDIIFSDISLDPGHTYYINVNNDQSNPRIDTLIKEVHKD